MLPVAVRVATEGLCVPHVLYTRTQRHVVESKSTINRHSAVWFWWVRFLYVVKQVISFNCLAAELDTNKTHCNLNKDLRKTIFPVYFTNNPGMLNLIELINTTLVLNFYKHNMFVFFQLIIVRNDGTHYLY